MKPSIVDVSDPRLHDKIKYDIKHKGLNIQWKVRLKQKLDPQTINDKTVYVYNENNKRNY